ncbi:MAG: GlxA family transcriptional regulator [Burkholderiaceae bacterium]|nr:GlxA family transcriptional regulator [Burkholderiaceae bacterium]
MRSMPARPAERHAFLLLPGCSLMAVGGALDALAQANTAQRESQSAGSVATLYDVLLCSVDGRPVRAGNGSSLIVDLALPHLPTLDGLFVVCDTPVPQSGFEAVLPLLQQQAASGALLGGVGTGAWLLARAGLLAGHRATLHWAYAPLLAEVFPDVVVSSNVFEADRKRLTCAGGLAAFDMFLHLIAQSHGPELAQQVQGRLGLERPRGPGEAQRVPLTARIGGGQPKLTEAVALMEANVQEPLATEDIARLVGVSRRQLERLFKQYLDNLPSRYYQELRLNRARQLLQQTSQSILQVGLSCGFSSGPHFSNNYRAHFGITPREQRSQRLNATKQPQDQGANIS